MANGLKFSEQELAELRQVVHGGYKKEDVRPVRGKGGNVTRSIGGHKIDYNYYGGLRPKNKVFTGWFDKYIPAEEGSASANFGKIAKELGIKEVSNRQHLQQMYDYVLGYTPPAAEPVQETAAPDGTTGFDSSNTLGGLNQHDPDTGQVVTNEPPDGTAGETTVGTTGETGPSVEDLLAKQIEGLTNMFTRSIEQQQAQFQQMQAAQDERMGQLMTQMQQAMVASQQRPEVAGVKMAGGSSGTPMQIARRGVTGAFNRRGMRISSLNV